MTLRLEDAVQLAAAGMAAATADGTAVAIVVLDGGGHLLCAQRHHEAYFSAFTIAQAKAFTALNFRRPTHEMAERLNTIEYAIQISQVDTRLAFVKGGLPIFRDGTIVGSIGVSGGSADQDLAYGQAAINAWSEGQPGQS